MSKEAFKDLVSDIQDSLFDIEHDIDRIDEMDMNSEESIIQDSCGYEWMHAMHHFDKMKEFIDEIVGKLDEEDEDDKDPVS